MKGNIAYFSMEIALEEGMPTYSGGLGVLAGDTIQSAANLEVPMIAVTLLHRRGYFYQKLDEQGDQSAEAVAWVVDDFLQEMPARTTVVVEGRPVAVRAWKYEVTGQTGHVVPVYLLDTDLADNADWDRTLTHQLYGGDPHYRLCQELILGMGGVRMLRALGHKEIRRVHVNEGHASMLVLELLNERLDRAGLGAIDDKIIDSVRRQCIFTTHTPVPAGHDSFPMEMVTRVVGSHPAFDLPDVFCCDGELNMTHLALNLSHFVNGVAKKHREISQQMFANYAIDSITNGVNAATWTSEPFQALFDKYIPGWREDNFNLRYALSIPDEAIWQAHAAAKKQLIKFVNRNTNAGMDDDCLTLGFARRAATYKRADLIFQDEERLKRIAAEAGPLQLVFAGKAHPSDDGGKAIIKRVFAAKEALKREIKIAYVANYDMRVARLMTAGVDVWLNTPIPPREASGTSGMKAALNGVPSLSILDGWWIEGCIEGVTGWAISTTPTQPDKADNAKDAASLYDKLESVLVPLFYHERPAFISVMCHAIALNGSFFNTQRMMQQYVLKAYFG